MAEGQRLGPRASYVYQLDDDQLVVLQLDSTLGDLPNTGLTRYDGTQPVCKKFVGFEPRYVRWQVVLADGKRATKKIICNNTAGSYYKSEAPQAITIDGDAGTTTGRVGEKYTYVRPTPITPAPGP